MSADSEDLTAAARPRRRWVWPLLLFLAGLFLGVWYGRRTPAPWQTGEVEPFTIGPNGVRGAKSGARSLVLTLSFTQTPFDVHAHLELQNRGSVPVRVYPLDPGTYAISRREADGKKQPLYKLPAALDAMAEERDLVLLAPLNVLSADYVVPRTLFLVSPSGEWTAGCSLDYRASTGEVKKFEVRSAPVRLQGRLAGL